MQDSTAEQLLEQIAKAEALGLNLLAARGRAAYERHVARRAAAGLSLGERLAEEFRGIANELVLDVEM